MRRADQIIVYGREHAADLLREADHARLTRGLTPPPWRPALTARLRELGRHLRPWPRSRPATLRHGIPHLANRAEASVP